VLLEVVLSMAIFFGMAAVLLIGVDSSVRAANRLRLEGQAADLAVTLLSEMQMGLVEPIDAGPETYEQPLQKWSWEIATSPLETSPMETELTQVEIIIRRVDGQCTYRLAHLFPAQDQESGGTGTEETAGGQP